SEIDDYLGPTQASVDLERETEINTAKRPECNAIWLYLFSVITTLAQIDRFQARYWFDVGWLLLEL
nr:hypothetical protein [Candidatus Poribacteria bacterium]